MTDSKMRPIAIAALATAVALATAQGTAAQTPESGAKEGEFTLNALYDMGVNAERPEDLPRLTEVGPPPSAVAAFGPVLAGAASAETGAAKASGTVRIAGIVLKWIRGDKEANYRRLEPLVRQAAAGGAQIVCTTECFLDGYAIADKTIPLETYRALGEPIPEGPYCRRLAALARELKIHLVAGLHEADGDKRCNTAVLLGPGGDLLGKYRKQMLEHESVRNTPGNSTPVFQTPFGRLGLIICADRRSPDIVRRMREAGADFLLCPSGGMFGPKTNDPILQARSRENSVHIVFVHPAEFLVTGPEGSVLSQSLPGGRLLVRPDEVGSAADRNRVCYFDMPLPAAAGAAHHPPPDACNARDVGFRLVVEEAQTQPAAGTLRVHVIDEAGKPLPARVHLRDAEGRYLLVAGQSTRQRAVYKGTRPVAGDWFYTDGSFSIDVGPGEAQIDIVHGPAYAPAHDAIPIVAGQATEKTYTLRRLIDLPAMGWYSADEHLHQRPDSLLMLAEDLNLAAIPICGGVDLEYRPGQKVTQLPDATHLLVSELPALEWDCFLWNLPKPVAMRLGKGDWPREDWATSDRPGGSADLRTSFVVRTPFLVEQMHEAGATLVAYMHDPPRLWYYPLYVANGWIDVYGVLENAYCSIANSRTEAEFWRGFDGDGFGSNFGIWYRFLNCGYRLPASAGTDNIGMGVGVWKGYNRVYAKLDGPLTVENWLSALKQGRSFVTNRPLLFVTVDGKEAGSELAINSAQAAPLNVDIHAVSATPISRIDILHQGRVLKHIEVDPPAADIRRTERITVPKSGWLAVRCLGRSENPNHSPAFALAHTSPFYLIVDGRPIRSPEDARYLHDQFSAFVNRSLPRVKNEQIRRALEAKCRDALAKYAAQAEIAQ